MHSIPLHAEPSVEPHATTPSRETFEAACTVSWAPLLRYLRAVVEPDLDIEDLAARCLEIAWRRRADITDVAGFTPWLLTIAANVAHNGRRSSRRMARLRTRIAGLRESQSPHHAAHAELVDSEPGPATRALATLNAGDREVLVLHAWEDLGSNAIAQVLDISRSAAAQRLHRARTRLHAALERLDSTGESTP
ncbi:MAG: RNA polymerase sigma factor [Thermoleophilia bacterium]|nr:RNA polymerase sigma factor [Thermoleophilia bacterium]